MTIKLTNKITGLGKLLTQFSKYAVLAEEAAESAIYIEAEKIITAAKRRTPVDTGVLRNSAHVQLPRQEGKSIFVEFGFGGPAGIGNAGSSNSEDVGYAIRVHEDIATFGSSPGGGSRNSGRGAVRKGKARRFVGQAKYLESVINERKPKMVENIAKHIRSRVKNAIK